VEVVGDDADAGRIDQATGLIDDGVGRDLFDDAVEMAVAQTRQGFQLDADLLAACPVLGTTKPTSLLSR